MAQSDVPVVVRAVAGRRPGDPAGATGHRADGESGDAGESGETGSKARQNVEPDTQGNTFVPPDAFKRKTGRSEAPTVPTQGAVVAPQSPRAESPPQAATVANPAKLAEPVKVDRREGPRADGAPHNDEAGPSETPPPAQ